MEPVPGELAQKVHFQVRQVLFALFNVLGKKHFHYRDALVKVMLLTTKKSMAKWESPS